MKKILVFLCSATILFAVSCSEDFDDSKIWDKLTSLENRIAALEQLCRQMNTNISSLQTVANVLQNNDYITNITPITEGDKVIGYTITFSKNGAITIYNGKDGKDGKDGYTPSIGIKKDSDNVYYWTLDNQWLLDDDGNKIKANGIDGQDGENGQDGQDGANGKDGQDGKDGITPKLKIEDGFWYISYDNEATWQKIGKASDENTNYNTPDIIYDDDYVYIKFSDGTIIDIPRRKNTISYTTSNGEIIVPYDTNVFGANIISNTYENGNGTLVFDENITQIGTNAFYNCETLTDITIPNSVTLIGGNAFRNCNNLSNITIPNSVTQIKFYAFADCKSLTKLTIPEGTISIAEGAFSGCNNLTSTTIPNSVSSIEKSAFEGCSGELIINNNEMLEKNYTQNLDYPSSTWLLNSQFTKLTIGDNVTKIANSVFRGCNSLASVKIGNSVTKIGERAFFYCINLTNIDISDSVTEIGESAFENCTSLKDVIIPDNVTTIGDRIFSGCKNLNSVTIGAGVDKIGNNMFYNCGSLTSISIPNNVTIIGDNAFAYCKSLTSIIFSDNITSIGTAAFSACSNLTKIILPNSVTKIYNHAFSECSNITTITIPASVSWIGFGAFMRCNLVTVFCESQTPPQANVIDNNWIAFNINATDRKIYVPTISVNAYKTADGWKEYASAIVGYNFE